MINYHYESPLSTLNSPFFPVTVIFMASPFGPGYHAAHRANAFGMGLGRPVSIPDAGPILNTLQIKKAAGR